MTGSQNAQAMINGTAFLAQLDDDWAQLIQQVGACKLHFKAEREPYEALVRAVAYQQLSTKVGDVIIQRLLDLHTGFPTAKQLAQTPFDDLRACGFSGRKVTTIQAIAQARLTELVPTREQADTMTNAALIERLTTLKGIGRWTVEMMLIFTLQRLDILPVDDLGIREGYKRLKKLDKAPTPKTLMEIGQAWQPHRTIASWYLWQVPKT